MNSPKYVVVEKPVGKTPLEVIEETRKKTRLSDTLPITYAGRLDPMASGKLLLLLGEECKQKEAYLALDKEYEFTVLLGVESDTGDVLGLVAGAGSAVEVSKAHLNRAAKELPGTIELPYPAFSSKTVAGKPLHTWTLEGRLNEITIPTKTSRVHQLTCTGVETMSTAELYQTVSKKIELVTSVTDPKKALGNDFRRPEVRAAWQAITSSPETPTHFTLASFRCICSSGTYMRTLAEVIAEKCGTVGLAFSIHRTELGHYRPLPFGFGFWQNRY